MNGISIVSVEYACEHLKKPMKSHSGLIGISNNMPMFLGRYFGTNGTAISVKVNTHACAACNKAITAHVLPQDILCDYLR